MIDFAYSFPLDKARKVSLVEIHGLCHEACKWTPRKKLEFFKAATPPQLRSGKFRPPDRLIASLHG